ncbi:hypothetical protein SADUNF_Sadunf16G0134200 [Salix dunnii]|uniref:Splicing factor Cactin n=1 Tax=Salix dunnii TaxID=1413687 RepID=A0A835JA12_9ROSI|nr:hypothetical protein SADUNF_Sadunf16G0134200 [Salix dunnii]
MEVIEKDQQKKEGGFLFNQNKIRFDTRVHQGRMKLFDILSSYIVNVLLDGSPDVEVELEEENPLRVFDGVSVKEMEELRDEICNFEIAEARKKDARVCGDELLVVERGFHSSVQAEVRSILERKTTKELEATQSEIELKMTSSEAKVVEHCEAVLKRLPMYKAKTCLKEIHYQYLQRYESSRKWDCAIPQLAANDEEQKNQIQETVEPDSPTLPEKFNLNKAMVATEEGDAVIGPVAELNLDSQVEWWCDKYRPRKPKYVNTFHTGYEWNEDNRARYDHDNPPPKIVLGYKFNIFYPDLINRTETPTYTCVDDGSNGETCIIRLYAGLRGHCIPNCEQRLGLEP